MSCFPSGHSSLRPWFEDLFAPKQGWAWWLTPSDQQEVDFIRKWIFPGGFLPTVSFATEAIRVGAENGLVVDSVSNIGVSRALSPSIYRISPLLWSPNRGASGPATSKSCSSLECADYSQPHYARTLREWRRRFLDAFNDRIGPAMRSEHPEMTDGDIEVFKRKWICEWHKPGRFILHPLRVRSLSLNSLPPIKWPSACRFLR